jgi:hypothetical protein
MTGTQAGESVRQWRESNALRRSLFSALLLLTVFSSPNGAGPPASAAQSSDLAANEKDECTKNLKLIYDAIEVYRKDHKDLPNWLSDLVPDYLPDANVLVCPVCRRTGQIEKPPLADPHIASSYLFEFCPAELGNGAPANPKATRREWKQRQMSVVGPIVPIVRCRHHKSPLNLAYDGRIYESPPSWEAMLTNTVDPQSLSSARMFAVATSTTESAAANKSFPDRDPKARPQLLDLTRFFNARLTDTWHGTQNATGNDLGSLTVGIQKLEGVEYDLRGVVQLASKAPTANRYPTNISGIKVGQKVQKLHFLHSGAFGKPADEGKEIGAYVLHFAGNQMRLEVPIVYGQDVRDWHFWPKEPDAPASLHVVWKGQNQTSKTANSYLRLFETTWTNIIPSVELESIDFVSKLSQPAPFLLAITVE